MPPEKRSSHRTKALPYQFERLRTDGLSYTSPDTWKRRGCTILSSGQRNLKSRHRYWVLQGHVHFFMTPQILKRRSGRTLTTMQTEATKRPKAFLKEKPNLAGQLDKISNEYGEALDAAFPYDLSLEDSRIAALQRVVETLHTSATRWDKPGTL